MTKIFTIPYKGLQRHVSDELNLFFLVKLLSYLCLPHHIFNASLELILIENRLNYYKREGNSLSVTYSDTHH